MFGLLPDPNKIGRKENMILAGHQREWLSKKTFSTKIYCQRNSHISSKTFKILIDNKLRSSECVNMKECVN